MVSVNSNKLNFNIWSEYIVWPRDMSSWWYIEFGIENSAFQSNIAKSFTQTWKYLTSYCSCNFEQNHSTSLKQTLICWYVWDMFGTCWGKTFGRLWDAILGGLFRPHLVTTRCLLAWCNMTGWKLQISRSIFFIYEDLDIGRRPFNPSLYRQQLASKIKNNHNY